MRLVDYLKAKIARRDLYFFALSTSWFNLIFLALFFYLLGNAFFAGIFTLLPRSINGQTPTFVEAFFFSVQTMSTIGYGSLSPTGVTANLLVTLEAFTGLIMVAIMTGVFFAKLSKPHAKIRFSKNILLSNFNGERTLCFRIGNMRGNDIVEAKINVSALINEVTSEGEKIRRIYNLRLRRSETPFFKLSWSIFHKIDEESPLWHFDKVLESLSAIMITVTGHDGTFSTTVYERHLYTQNDIVKDRYFVDIIRDHGPDNIEIDYSKFDELK